jgi:hypothetical protein
MNRFVFTLIKLHGSLEVAQQNYSENVIATPYILEIHDMKVNYNGLADAHQRS